MKTLKIKEIVLLSIFIYDFIVLLNFLLIKLNNSPEKQSGLFTFSIILFFSFILAIINPNSQIDNSPVIPNNIHNFLIVLIFVLFFLINIETILFLFTNLFNTIYG